MVNITGLNRGPQSKEDNTQRVGDFSSVRYKESRKGEGVERGGGRGSLLFKAQGSK